MSRLRGIGVVTTRARFHAHTARSVLSGRGARESMHSLGVGIATSATFARVREDSFARTWQRPAAGLTSVASKHTGDAGLLSCWSCNADMSDGGLKTPMFCGKCGSIQPVVADANLFDVFGLEHRFDVDVKDLDKRYKVLMAQMHPDRWMQKSEQEQHYSSQHSSVVNDGYARLKAPHARAIYMLKLLGLDFETQTRSESGGENNEFMMEVMEMSLAIQEADGNQERLRDIHQTFYVPRLSGVCQHAKEAFEKQDIESARHATAKLQYLHRIGNLLADSLDLE